MISSVFALKEANTIPDYLINNKETGLEENYYFNSSLDFLLECQNELLSYRRNFYKFVLETGDENPYVINEAFEDIITGIVDIIKKILAYIESIIARFITSLNKFVSSDKYIIKMKKEISKFPKNKSFTISGYNYTINDKVPVVDIVGLDLSHLQIAINNLNGEDIDSQLKSLSDQLIEFVGEDGLTRARNQILNSPYDIPEASFANEIFSTYRDGKSEEGNINIHKEDVNRALSDFEGYKSKIKHVNKLKADISSKYKLLEFQVNNIIKENFNNKINTYSDNKVRSSLINHLNVLISEQVNTIQRISNYHVQAIAGKLDAYNALVIQDRNILYKALSTVQGDINNMRIMENYTSYDYTRDANYKGYLLERYYMNKEQELFVNECLALSESNIPELKVINEDLKMNVKGKFERLKQFIKQIFEKFLMKINNFITGDKTFLEKYKDIILNKKVEEYTLNDMPDYEAGIKNIKDPNNKLKKIDIKTILEKTEDQIRKDMLPAFSGDGDFTEFAKNYFLSNNTNGKDRNIKSTQLNMTEIYSFCVNAKDAIKVLEQDRNTFSAAAESAKNEVIKNIKSTSEAVSIYGEKYYYSSVLESYINEDGEAENKDSAAGTTNTTSTTITDKGASEKANTDTKIDFEVSKQDRTDNHKNLKDDVKSEDKGKDDKQQAEENKDADYKKVEETATWYLNTLKTICSAKITAFQKIYKEYMKILRYHVSKATGSLGTASKFTDDDEKSITNAMKEYKNANDDNGRTTAANKIINIYKSKNIVIDAHDVQNLVKKNEGKLG